MRTLGKDFSEQKCAGAAQRAALLLIAIAKSFFRLIILIVGAQRAVPSKPHRARLAVPLQDEITFGNGYKKSKGQGFRPLARSINVLRDCRKRVELG